MKEVFAKPAVGAIIEKKGKWEELYFNSDQTKRK